MQRSVHIALVLGCASVLLLGIAMALSAQATPDHVAGVLARMRADFSARRYAAVITRANGLLESAHAISTPQRIELWQLLAAAYYPDGSSAQLQPDSARLPLAALIRLAPDIRIAREISWAGLDELVERTRAGTFAVATRPLTEYTLNAHATGHVAVVASRPTRFRLMSVDDSGGRTVIHDSSAFVTSATLQLRTHDATGPIFVDGSHQLHIWAYDLSSGDSVRIAHRVRALRSDLPPPIADSGPPDAAAPSPPPVAPAPARQIGARHWPSMLWGGLALAAATAVIAQEARPDDGLRSAFRVDARAFVVSAAMVGATVVNAYTSRAPTPPAARVMTLSPRPPPPPTIDTYQVRLQIDSPDR